MSHTVPGVGDTRGNLRQCLRSGLSPSGENRTEAPTDYKFLVGLWTGHCRRSLWPRPGLLTKWKAYVVLGCCKVSLGWAKERGLWL